VSSVIDLAEAFHVGCLEKPGIEPDRFWTKTRPFTRIAAVDGGEAGSGCGMTNGRNESSRLRLWGISRSEMAPYSTRIETNRSVEDELRGQVQRARQALLNASDDCADRADRHFRNVLHVFSDLILNGENDEGTKAARYLRLQQRIRQKTAADNQRA
jgi:hypothetical protein